MKRIFQLIALLNISLFSCAQTNDYDKKLESLYKGTVPTVMPDSVPKGAVFLDTREVEEFDISHIENAICTGYDDFNTESVKHLSKSDIIVVYCSVGYRSERIGEKLLKMGFSDVYNLYGGIFQWKNEGNKVVNTKGEETEKVHTYNKNWSKWLTRGEKVY
jgi:rhodanese-related sulfurtransferase